MGLGKRGVGKKGSTLIFDQIIFILIVLTFSVIMFMFIVRFGNSSAIKEQIYSKQIALVIDKARVGTEIIMDVSDIFQNAGDNKFKGELIKIDNENKKVILHLAAGNGNSYGFFNNELVSWNINDTKKGEEKLIININER